MNKRQAIRTLKALRDDFDRLVADKSCTLCECDTATQSVGKCLRCQKMRAHVEFRPKPFSTWMYRQDPQLTGSLLQICAGIMEKAAFLDRERNWMSKTIVKAFGEGGKGVEESKSEG